jgi:hypothetical protein
MARSPSKFSKDSPMTGFFIAACVLAVPLIVLFVVLPQWNSGLDERRAAAKAQTDEFADLQKKAVAAKVLYEGKYQQTYEAAQDMDNLLKGAELQDHLTAAALVIRQRGNLKLNVVRHADADKADPLLSFLFPTLHFEQFHMELEGALPDVVDFLRTEVEQKYPFATYSELEVSAASGAGRGYPKYALDVWFPVKPANGGSN